LNNHGENIYILFAMTEEELKQFKAVLSITAVATALGVHVVHGRCRCFFPTRHSHGDRTPSVSFSEERGTFRCWVCDDVRGDVISLVQIVKNCSFLEALNWLKETYGFLVPGAKSPVQNRVATMNPVSATALPKGTPAPSESIAQNAALVTKAAVRDASLEYSSPEPAKELVSEDERKKIILSFLKMLSPVDKTPAAAYLARRRIYKPVWDKMLLRTITDYGTLNNKLKETYDLEVLKYVGLFSEKGNLRYYKHPLFFPYLDTKRRSSYFQARAIDSSVVPKELNLRGTVPFPYNISALDGRPGWVYLCEGVVDTLTFLGQSIAAIGIPGVRSFKTEWLPLFKNKSVVLCLDKDEAGRSGTEYLQSVFAQAGIRTVVLGDGVDQFGQMTMKEGDDINSWFGGKK
jgi:DNA primase